MAEVKTCGKPLDTLVERVLSMNILSSDYFKELYGLKSYHEVVDEIYNQVDHVEPWMTGNCRGPSTAFCLLYKFFTMKLTVKQMHGILKHPDSPYIRAVGFLYLRYLADPKTLWNWFEPYIEDDEQFSPGSSGKMTTMGVYVRDLLLGQYYFDTLFPRVPVPVVRQIIFNLEKMNLPSKHSGVTGENSRHGSDDTARRPPSVKASLSVSFGQRAPHRASTRDSSPVRRAQPPSLNRTSGEGSQQSPSRHHSQSRDREYTNKDIDGGRNRDLGRDRDTGQHKDKNRNGDRDRYRGRERSRDTYTDYDRDRRSRHSERESSRYRESSRRSRSRSPSGRLRVSVDRYDHSGSHRGAGESKEKMNASANLAKLRDMYGDLNGKGDSGTQRSGVRDGGAEDVIRLGGSTWK